MIAMVRFIALLIACVFLVSASPVPASDTPASWEFPRFHPTMPSAPFESYEGFFKYIARLERLPEDQHTLFVLAADSTLERYRLSLIGNLIVVRPDYYERSEFGIRGAQGQGRYYAFQVLPVGWKLVGIFHGNTCRLSESGKEVHVYTRWHMSAFDRPQDENKYTLNGQFFE
jgi:hypothetical protein